MNAPLLLSRLPIGNKKQTIAAAQSTGDIINEVLAAHRHFAPQYQKIAEFFEFTSDRRLAAALFKFCKKEIDYEIEGDLQTTRSPGVLLRMAKGDCKHYAGFIAGVLDARRRLGFPVKWAYRFASYDLFDSTPRHVFVVIDPGTEGELWVDPVLERLDQRDPFPTFYIDKRVNMALQRLSGFSSNNSNLLPARRCCVGGARVGDVYDQTIEAAKDVLSFLPEGGLKSWLTTFVGNPVKGLKELILGKKYTSGDYALGEIFMRNILGQPEIQNRGMVPDGVVPQAWDFFTSALGVRIGSGDHLNELAKSPTNYFNWLGVASDDVPQANAQRAHEILKLLGYPANQLDARRNVKWNLKTFAAKPYIFPLPGTAVGTMYNGQHPILGVRIENGMPAENVPAGGGLSTGGGGGFTAGFNFGEFIQKNPLLAMGIVGAGLYFVVKSTKKR